MFEPFCCQRSCIACSDSELREICRDMPADLKSCEDPLKAPRTDNVWHCSCKELLSGVRLTARSFTLVSCCLSASCYIALLLRQAQYNFLHLELSQIAVLLLWLSEELPAVCRMNAAAVSALLAVLFCSTALCQPGPAPYAPGSGAWFGVTYVSQASLALTRQITLF